MAAKKKECWGPMYKDWVANIKTIKELVAEYGVSRTAIEKHWDKEGVERDLSGKIKAQADAKVAKSLVESKVELERDATNKEVIEANAENSANIQIHERADVTSARNLTQKLFKELEAQTDGLEEFEKIGEILASENTDRMQDLYNKVVNFPGRVKALKELTDAMRIQIELERKVYSIDGVDRVGSIEDFIKANRSV